MLLRITVSLLAAAGIFFACGPRTPTLVSGTAHTHNLKDTTVSAHVSIDTVKGAVRFAIALTNGTRRRLEVNFPNGRTHDFVVLDSNNREVWRWSEGRLFTQGMQNKLVDSHDSVIYNETWNHPAPGNYTLVALLNSENHPVRQRVPFALP